MLTVPLTVAPAAGLVIEAVGGVVSPAAAGTSVNEPDLLLYWATDALQGNVLPRDAQLVGAFSTGRAFLLPWNGKGAGHLVLFSPAHQTVFDTAAVEKLP